MAPNLRDDQRKRYIAAEREFIEELLEDTTDCKWVYQALVELAFLEAKLDGAISEDSRQRAMEWISQLKLLDPLRAGRWAELENSIN
jgi:geranylgeranyl transferase type-2 subunit alpha